MSEAAFRPADAVGVGQVEPVTLNPEDFQAAPPAAVATYPADATGNVVQDVGSGEEKDFINNPVLPAAEGNDITSVSDITARINGVMAEDVTSIIDVVMGKLIAESIYEVNLKDQLGGMFESQGLNEDFTDKASDIFEAAVTSAAKKHLETLSESAQTYVTQQLGVFQQTLSGHVNGFLNNVVNEWAEENKLAIEMGARTRIAESFMDGLKSLLEAHYVELPKDRVDLYESACSKGDELLDKLDESAKTINALNEEIKSLKKGAILESAIKNVSAVSADKIRSLAESIEFTDAESYKTRLDLVVESFNARAAAVAKPITEAEVVVPAATTLNEDTAPQNDVEKIAAALGRFTRK